jgi:hypothetical protein
MVLGAILIGLSHVPTTFQLGGAAIYKTQPRLSSKVGASAL